MDELAGLKSGEEHGVTRRRTWSFRDNYIVPFMSLFSTIENDRKGKGW